MTIKRTQHFDLPVVGEFIRTTTLKPGHKQKLRYVTPNEDGRGFFKGDKIMTVIDPDSVEVTTLSFRHDPPNPLREEIEKTNEPQGPQVLVGEDIKYVVDGSWGGEARGSMRERVDISWEPTLPNQSRK